MLKRVMFTLTAFVLLVPAITIAAPVVFEASGSEPADIQAAVDDFRAFLGDNNRVGGTLHMDY